MKNDMLELLKFILSDIWHFCGTALLIYVIFEGLAKVIRALRGKDY